MSFRRLQSSISDLPYALREQILGFATYVEDASDELLATAGIREPSEDQADQLVYVAGLWRMWQIINGLCSLLDNSLALLETRAAMAATPNGAGIGYRMGGNFYSRTSADYRTLLSLRGSFSSALDGQGLGFVRTARGLPALVRSVVRQDGF